MIKNFVYLGYYFKKTNWRQFAAQISYVNKTFGYGKLHLLFDMFFSTLRRGNSFHEYYYYAFYSKNKKERDAYATMGFMYEYQKKFNPVRSRFFLENKIKFFDAYSEFIRREWIKIKDANTSEIEKFILGKQKIVLKKSLGGGGKSVNIYFTDNLDAVRLKEEAKKYNFDLAEEFVYQHPELEKLSPNSLNTIRFITQITKDNTVDIIGAILRMGIYGHTDNLSSGGIACNINIINGLVNSNGITFNITNPDYERHPVSNKRFIGFQIPYWNSVKKLCEEAALKHPVNKSVGWDVAIRSDGPLLIEGNNEWGARVWQMPQKKGLKHKLLKYFDN